MFKMRRALIAVLAVGLAGCTASQFERPDTTQQHMDKDKYECELTARTANAGRSVQQDLYRRCMGQRGYSLRT